MKILVLVAIYILPIVRFIACIRSEQLKQKIQNAGLFSVARFVYAFLALMNVVVIVLSVTEPSSGSSNGVFAYYFPVQVLLIIVAEVLIAKAKMAASASQD